MKRPLYAALAWLCIALIAVAASAATAADWSVVQMSGKVVVEVAGARPASLSTGETLPAGGVLKTGDDSRAMLVRGQDQMIVGPNSVVALPAGQGEPQFTRIVQATGVVEFTVEKRSVPHFSGTTSKLAAVVKGTHFAVGVFHSGDVIKVARGRVQVTALESGQVVDVVAGQQATVRPRGVLSVTGQGPLAPILQGAPPLAPDGSPQTIINQASAGDGLTGSGLAASPRRTAASGSTSATARSVSPRAAAASISASTGLPMSAPAAAVPASAWMTPSVPVSVAAASASTSAGSTSVSVTSDAGQTRSRRNAANHRVFAA